jgi:hypothetical protein
MHYESATRDTPYQLTEADWQEIAERGLAETHRERIVKLIFLVYWLLIFEGALRKWVLPPFQKEIYFIRDPVVLAIYWLSIRYRLFKHSSITITILIAVAWLCVMEIMYHMVVDQSDLLLTGAGLRSYFLYVPLAAVIAETFERADLERLVRLTLLLAIPIALISVLQSRSPDNAMINHGISDNPEYQVHSLPVGEGVMRTAGTFTSNIGQSLFVGSIVAMLVWVWTLPSDRRPLRGAALLAVTAATMVNVAVSGQRMIFILVALVLFTAFVAALLMKGVGNSWNVLKTCAVLAAVGVLVGPTLFPTQLHALATRSAGAAEGDDAYSYGVVNRALHDFVAFEDSIDSTPFAGYGIGQTSNAASILHRTSTGWSENEWQRHVIELGPFLGMTLILFRIGLVVWLCTGACIAARRHEDALGLLLFGFIAAVVLYFPVTSQGTVTGYAWIFAGFCVAASQPPKIRWEL